MTNATSQRLKARRSILLASPLPTERWAFGWAGRILGDSLARKLLARAQVVSTQHLQVARP